MNRYKYLLKNIIAFLLGNIGTKIIGFLMVPLYTNVLSTAEYGEVDLLLSITGVITPFIACGIHEGVMRFALDKGANHKLIFSIGIKFFLLTAVVGILCFPIISFIPSLRAYGWFIYFYSVLSGFLTLLMCYIRGKDNIRFYAVLGVVSAFITAGLNILFLVFLKWGIIGYLSSMVLGQAITSVIAIIGGKLTRDFSIKLWDKKTASNMLKYSLPLIPNAFLWWCINASGRVFITYMCSASANGLFAAAYKIPTLLNMVATIFMQSWQMTAIKEHDSEDSEKFYEKMYRMLTFVMCIATAVLIILNRPILRFYVAEEFFEAWRCAPPLMVAFFFGALGTFWGSFYIAEKKTNRYVISAAVGAVTNIVLNYLLIKYMDITGAAIATAASYLAVLLVRGIGAKSTAKINLINKPFCLSAVCLGLVTFASYIESDAFVILIGTVVLATFVLLNLNLIKDALFFVKRIIYIRCQ